MATFQLYAILEAIGDRLEMHNNIGEQRDNWNTLLLNSINMITLTAATMAGFAAATGVGAGVSAMGLKLASSVMFSAATGMLALASAVNTFEHGGQVGMVFEMYRNNAGFFKHMQESIESTLDESDVEKRENGELFEIKVALQLGRSLSELRDVAKKSSYSRIEGSPMDEFASKLF
ncbi:hypothetical protein GOBAR_AA06785 [Gossypium barbadense]|uniref:F-box protein n=1 Tax=Gossypium barbadense TaxID=3634 RepID=A0A2P5YDZ2_GOSBA|nr:hypothetical protein GOBAR_AA06785 [Gossypium barbadense]